MLNYFQLFVIALCTHIGLAQELKSLNDSVLKYKSTNPKLALEFGFEGLKFIDQRDTYDYFTLHSMIGEVFYQMEIFKSSFEYLTRALKLYDDLPKSQRRNRNVNQPPWVLIIIGNVHYKNKDFDKARKFFEEAHHNFKLFDAIYEEEKNFGLNTSQSNIALIEIELKNFSEAEKLYDTILKRRISFGKQLDIMASHYNFMDLYSLLDKEEMVKDSYRKIDSIFQQHSQTAAEINPEIKLYSSYASTRFGIYLAQNNKWDKSITYFKKAKDLLQKIPYEIPRVNLEMAKSYLKLNEISKAKALIEENLNFSSLSVESKLNNYKLLEKAYGQEDDLTQLMSVKDSIIFLNTVSLQKEANEEFNILQNLLVATENQNELKLLKLQNNRIILISMILVFFLIFIILSIRISFNLQKEKNARLELEKKEILNRLKMKQRELVSKVNFISLRNQYINKINDQLDKNFANSRELKTLKSEMKEIVISEKVYADFEKMFVEVYPKFYKNLAAMAKLTKTDLRLASFIKMKLNNDEILRISGISIRTLESQRYRLSKKLPLKKEESLNDFINVL